MCGSSGSCSFGLEWEEVPLFRPCPNDFVEPFAMCVALGEAATPDVIARGDGRYDELCRCGVECGDGESPLPGARIPPRA